MSKKRLQLRFLLDEGVPTSVGEVLEAAGHQVIYFNASGIVKSSSDEIVCLTAKLNSAILIAADNDMKGLVRGHGVTKAQFSTLSLLKLDCASPESASRVASAISLVEHEWRKGRGQPRRLYVTIGDTVIRTYR